MAVAKRKPNMKKPATTGRGSKTGKLMDNQDRVSKGDGEEVQKVPTTILLPLDLKERAQSVAKGNGTTLTWLITEGLYLKLEEYGG